MGERRGVWYKDQYFQTIHDITAPEVKKYSSGYVRRLFHEVGNPPEILIRNIDGLDFVSYSHASLVPARKTFDLAVALACGIDRMGLQAGVNVLEIGTGSGVFPITLRSLVQDRLLDITATDISGDALTVAELNAQLNEVATDSITWLKADGLSTLFGRVDYQDVVFSNPPFSPTGRFEKINPSRVNPALALDGGPEGTDYYRRFLLEALNVLKHDGIVIFQLPLNKEDLLRTIDLIKNISWKQVRFIVDSKRRYKMSGPQFAVIGENELIQDIYSQGYEAIMV